MKVVVFLMVAAFLKMVACLTVGFFRVVAFGGWAF